MIKNLHSLVGVKNIALTFGCWDDGAGFDELTITSFSVYLVTSAQLAIYGLNQKMSPSPSIVRLAGIASVNLCLHWRSPFFCWRCQLSPSHFEVASFSSGVFLIEPLVF
jgi:hypothetical protein